MLTTFIAGPPLPPYLQFNRSTLLVYWDEPFTVASFPILGYILTTFSSGGNKTYPITGRNFSLARTGIDDIVNITVKAQNAVGNSLPGVLCGKILFVQTEGT